MAEPSAFRLNVLAMPPVRRVLLAPAFLYAAQGVFLAVFFVLLGNGWGVGIGEDAGFLKILRKTNTTTLLIWGLWWPLMVLGAIFFCRAWCAVCPMELVSHLSNRLGRRLHLARFALAAPLRKGFGVLALYLALQILVGFVSIHRVPGYTSYMLLGLFLLPVVSGLLLRDRRGFCKGFCPANLLLSVYGRISPVEIDREDSETCEKCTTQECFQLDRVDRWHGRSCPSRVAIFSRQKGDACVQCFQCAKACPHDNVGYGLVSGSAPSRSSPALTAAEALFVVFVSGFIMHEIFTEAGSLERIYHWPAERFRDLTATAVPWGWIHTVWYLLVFPVAVWLGIVGIARLTGARGRALDVLRYATTAAFPIVAAGHAAKALAKLNSWGGYLPLSLSDPHGVPAARAIVSHAGPAPGVLVSFPLVALAGLCLAGTLAFLAWRRMPKVPEGAGASARVGILVILALYAGVLLTWPLAHP